MCLAPAYLTKVLLAIVGVQLAVAHSKVLYSLFDIAMTLSGKENFSNIAP